MTVVDPVLDWYRHAARQLPWRDADCTPWGVLVSEVMLQQTQVDRVLPIWRTWMDRWPTPQALASAPLAEVLHQWGRLGYPRRARWLWESAQHIVEKYECVVPDDETTLRQLPGIGAYTAAAVCAFAFRQRTVVLDTNVRRVLSRVLAGQALPSPHITNAERAAAAALLPEKDPALWSVAVMELGALICTAQRPRCPECPLQSQCAWFAAGCPPSTAPRRRQATYRGSDREARGAVLAALRTKPATRAALTQVVPDAERRKRALESLIRDGLITRERGRYRLGVTTPDSTATGRASG